ncbi:MAG: hypothetical protein AAGF97_03600, partial [Planctomycetota bacterium]
MMLDTVPDSLYRRHLGLPLTAEIDDPLAAKIQAARDWFVQHADPLVTTREIDISRIVYAVIHLANQTQLHSTLLAQGFARAHVDRIVLAAITAGASVDERIDELWRGDRPDEAMFLNAYAIAAVEHWRAETGKQLTQRFASEGRTVLPHYSPGYDGWGLSDQARLYRLLAEDGIPIQLLASGGLSPNKSTLAVYGITPRRDFGEPLAEYWTCRVSAAPSRTRTARYAFPEKTLKKWRDQRLKLRVTAEGNVDAEFKFDGSTCSNLGVPIAYDYSVQLQPEDARYRIVASDCQPRENHHGFRSMCAYLNNPDQFVRQLEEHRPLVGEYLTSALTWDAPVSPA